MLMARSLSKAASPRHDQVCAGPIWKGFGTTGGREERPSHRLPGE